VSEISQVKPLRTTRELLIDGRYLLIPISEAASPTRVHVGIGVEFATSFTAKLGEPADWWAHIDVGAWRSKKIAIEFDDGAAEAANAITLSEDMWDAELLYRESTRPLFHFTASRGWLNDPNGLVFHREKFHLYFQHNPFGLTWGNTHWGHAVSDDLIHWEEGDAVLRPIGDNDFPWSGSAVVDLKNTSGWAVGAEPALVVAFTSSDRGECIAYSRDGGMTLTECDQNPVVVHDGRDPRIMWHEPTRAWVMAVYDVRQSDDGEDVGGIAFFRSQDLKTWDWTSWIPGFFECPDLFQLAVDEDETDRRWVLTAAPGDYVIGDFDGFAFDPTSERLPAPTGESAAQTIFFAGQTISNHPEGECVQMAWGLVHVDGAPFSQVMLVPTVLSLRTTADGIRLCREPINALRTLRKKTHRIANVRITSESQLELSADAWDIEARVAVAPDATMGAPIEFQIGADTYSYRIASQALTGPGGSMHIPAVGGELSARILIDRTTVEIFGDRGQAYGVFRRTDPGKPASLAIRLGSPHPSRHHSRIIELLAHELARSWDGSSDTHVPALVPADPSR